MRFETMKWTQTAIYSFLLFDNSYGKEFQISDVDLNIAAALLDTGLSDTWRWW